ncbi:N-acetylmuramoyl-L-alanine amidase CwlD [Gracilibacillus caseinilyticus]|uniref:N-acetylmuramoyl-L-alanine amidase CwlD n=1 Tax=Gracilibacillus caseinilyticus TaxID=2932256 RepID=A0ABY4EZE9_9BACI|nr:N-acetylmuramoyl-L-alanine amidase CwlD [Gracilibacillus caseinilyticus]UOQ49381.1 N-acetylmuramoyl-L-alanine amidase CwlD [Gracilibacillus caseinilyticus]
MSKKMKVMIWLIGLFLLIILMQYPMQRTMDSWQTWSLPLAGTTIVLDPGHGGADGGAEGSDDTQEKEIALSVSNMVRDYLQQAGAVVYMTREGDYDLAQDGTKGLSRRKTEDIQQRVAFIKEKKADLFLSIHLNALAARQWKGAQTFFYPGREQNEMLAKSIQSEIRRNLENTNREALALNQIYLLKYSEIPGALVEIGFLSNEEEKELLKSTNYQQKMAASIYKGMLQYVTEDPSND